MLETVGCKISNLDLVARAEKMGGVARALKEASATSRTLVTSVEEVVVAGLSTLRCFAFWARISLGITPWSPPTKFSLSIPGGPLVIETLLRAYK